jgi:hypothetical protein
MTLETIEAAVSKLPPADLEKFRDWFDEFSARAWDEQIERDVKAGKLDKLADKALADHKAGRTHEL